MCHQMDFLDLQRLYVLDCWLNDCIKYAYFKYFKNRFVNTANVVVSSTCEPKMVGHVTTSQCAHKV
jgi:hypothetical protein